ncbi:hypothetical protein LCGC14_2118920 [marine sediment metagenome]|uniref:Uncharacterized protein n=1 Tax=marine sediment metagenome TaxID=412755 RepID=A0A0F9GHY2_9ZZZZ
MGGGKGGKVKKKTVISGQQRDLLNQLLGIAGTEEFLNPEVFGRLPGARESQFAAERLLGQALSPDSDVFNEFFRSNIFSGCSFYQWWTTNKNGTLVLYNNGLIAHRGNICTASSAGAHN